MNYIGSKYSLLSEIENVLDGHSVPRDGIALDLFSGTGAVGQLLKLRGYATYANDWQCYSYLTNVAFLAFNDFPKFANLLSSQKWGKEIGTALCDEEILTYSIAGREPLPRNLPGAQVLCYLDRLEGTRGPFFESYCSGGEAERMYFSEENGLRIQAIRDLIEGWFEEGSVSSDERAWLVACLIEAADRVANTASVYGAYLKHVKKTARKPLRLVALQPISSPHPPAQHRVYCEDSLKLLERFFPGEIQLTYVDTPYNHRQYAANYHILETIARWDMDQFEPRGVTGLRKAEEQRSDFCVKTAVEASFRQLFERIRSNYLLLSYNDEGLLGKDALLGLFEEFCTDVSFTQIKFKRFRADIDHENRVYKRDHTHEFLVLGKLCP
jgi:adenine-specific DNA-methyltransferase